MTEFDPRHGERYGIAWRAIRAAITNTEGPLGKRELAQVARDATPIQSTSSRNLVHDLIRHGWIAKARRGYKLTSKGRAAA